MFAREQQTRFTVFIFQIHKMHKMYAPSKPTKRYAHAIQILSRIKAKKNLINKFKKQKKSYIRFFLFLN